MSKAGRNVVFFLILAAIRVDSKSQVPEGLILNMLEEQKPLVIYVKPVVKSTSVLDQLFSEQKQELDDLLESDEDDLDGLTLEESARERAKYILYQFLTSPNDQDSEDSSEDPKVALRQALRNRCLTVKKCITTCTIDQYSCPSTCKKIIDKPNLCQPPKDKCKKSRCGKTMPPKWLL